MTEEYPSRWANTLTYSEWIQLVIADELPPPPIAALIGFRLVRAERGTAVVEFQATSRHANPMGTLHGGVICDIADAAMGCALGSTLPSGESCTTIELKANFFKPVWEARLTAAARIVRKTRTLCFLECDVRDERRHLIARLSRTCSILRGESARGR